MTTPNPWNKRKSGGREFMPPSRALLAQGYLNNGSEASSGTATWCYAVDGTWHCKSASKLLRWMRGMQPRAARRELDSLCVAGVLRWHWIEPNTARVLAPPF